MWTVRNITSFWFHGNKRWTFRTKTFECCHGVWTPAAQFQLSQRYSPVSTAVFLSVRQTNAILVWSYFCPRHYWHMLKLGAALKWNEYSTGVAGDSRESGKHEFDFSVIEEGCLLMHVRLRDHLHSLLPASNV